MAEARRIREGDIWGYRVVGGGLVVRQQSGTLISVPESVSVKRPVTQKSSLCRGSRGVEILLDADTLLCKTAAGRRRVGGLAGAAKGKLVVLNGLEKTSGRPDEQRFDTSVG